MAEEITELDRRGARQRKALDRVRWHAIHQHAHHAHYGWVEDAACSRERGAAHASSRAAREQQKIDANASPPEFLMVTSKRNIY